MHRSQCRNLLTFAHDIDQTEVSKITMGGTDAI